MQIKKYVSVKKVVSPLPQKLGRLSHSRDNLTEKEMQKSLIAIEYKPIVTWIFDRQYTSSLSVWTNLY